MLPNETTFVTAAKFRVSKTSMGDSLGEFIYGKSYLQRPDAVELDPCELVLSSKKYETSSMQGFFGAIRDAMPDYWGRRVIEKHSRKVGLEEFDYLMYSPDDRAGALGFGREAEPPAPHYVFNQKINLNHLQEIAWEILNHQNLHKNPKEAVIQAEEFLLLGTSMGGERPKAVIEDNESLWVAKFSSPEDRWNHPGVEHAFLELAKACGIQAAESKITKVGEQDVLLIRRFDRNYTPEGYQRHRMISALTMLKKDDSTSSRQKWSYLVLADEIRRISQDPKSDLKELFLRMCFNALISNLDDHPRNHAMLAKGTTWRLSPAYDLTPTITIAEDARYLAMTCGHFGRMAKLDNLLSAHARFLLEKSESERLVKNLMDSIKTKWHPFLKKAGVSEADIKIISSAFLYPGFFQTSESEI